MSRHLIEKYRQRHEQESGGKANPWGGRLAVALIYPNTYHQGMSNLGLQTVYRMLNERDDALCERFFLPDPEYIEVHRRTGFPLVSIESQRSLSDFDLIAFSISFENDYLNLPPIFELGRMPFWPGPGRVLSKVYHLLQPTKADFAALRNQTSFPRYFINVSVFSPI